MLALLAAFLLPQIAAPDVPALDAAPASVERPNILWLSFEDHGPQLGCYGDDYADTPVLDGLAASGIRYERCWSNAPVCSTARTTLITGRYATSLGAHHHRSRLPLPDGVRFFPQLLREAGYFCTNNRKEDYNLAKPQGTWDMSGNNAHWRKRAPGQPFFAVVNVTISHESQIRKRPHKLVHDPGKFELPPYYPDLPEIRRDWAQEYDKGTEMDTRLGQVLAELREDGLEEDTIIFAFGDHGSGMPRHKRWPGDSGQRVPLILVVPEKWKHLRPEGYESGAMLKRLVAFVDFGPTVLSLAGIKADEGMQGVPFLGKFNGPDKKYLFGYRGRMDERDDEVRVITDGRYVYLWNFDGARPHGAHVSYQFETPTTKAWYEYARDNPDAPAAIRDYWFGTRGPEDLFDLAEDPHEVSDLIEIKQAASVRNTLSQELRRILIATQDLGFIPEHMMIKQLHQGTAKFEPEYLEAARNTWIFAHDGWANPASLSKSDDPVLRWWAAQAILTRSRMTREGIGWRSNQTDGGVRVQLARSVLLDAGDHSALQSGGYDRPNPWDVLLQHAGPTESNYFIRLLAWQALDEAIVHGQHNRFIQRRATPEFRTTVESISTDHPDLDGAFRNYLPRLKEKVLAELASD
jgi:uncharacterized sulfatase